MNELLVTNICSTSPPGGNQVDGLPVSNTGVMHIRVKLSPINFCYLDAFARVQNNWLFP
jgi:hypothetical protein